MPASAASRNGSKRSDASPVPGARFPASPFCMRRGAQGSADQGRRLSEPQASSRRTPPNPSTAGFPQRQRRDADSRGDFFWCLFLFALHVRIVVASDFNGKVEAAL